MQRVDGVERVRVSLNDGLTILDLKPDNSVKMATLRQIIRHNGFVTKDAKITARGQVTSANGRRLFQVSGTNEALEAATEPERTADGWKLTVED